MVIVETAIFTKQVKELLSDENYREFQEHLASNPGVGVVIKDTGGLRKIRWKTGDSGKRGGVRVIYFHVASADRLLLIYQKGVKDDLSAAEKRVLRDINRNW
jgi:hypothetical protein